MVFLNIILGLLGLGLVVIVHELGHFAAAKAFGIKVEAFSVGWGKVLLRKNFRGTEYRLSLLPVGGYCKMKGEDFIKQSEEPQREPVLPQPNSLFGVSPWKRGLTYFAGPFFNFIFSILVLSIIWFAGFTVNTLQNRIILQSETIMATKSEYPADRAGFQTGDRIVEIDGKPVETFRDVEQLITPSAEENLDVTVQREGRLYDLSVTPGLDPETGAGFIGVAAWVEPLVAQVSEKSNASQTGVLPADRIVKANGAPVDHTLDLYEVLEENPAQLDLVVERDGLTRNLTMPVAYDEEGNVDLGFAFAGISFLERERNPFAALKQGFQETFSTLALSVRSIALLFKGVNLRSAVSGPIRITYMVGEVASQGFNQGIGRGLFIVFRFLSMLSVALCFMNLLPIPALDGGFIVIAIAETIFKKPIRPKFFYRYQIIGFAILFGILILTLFNDVFYFAGR